MPRKRTYREAVVYHYSLWEWLEYLKKEGFQDVTLGFFCLQEGVIHVLDDLYSLKVKRPDLYASFDWRELDVESTLAHEYTHYLQWRKGAALGVYDEEGDPVCQPLGLKKAKALLPRVVDTYNEEEWEIEMEAFYVEERPHLLNKLSVY